MLEDNSVEREMAAGKFWRAKEILQGRLRSAGYDTALYERYGFVLLQLGDHCEAGKYLFLSGSRKPAYEEPIGIFMGRHGKSIGSIFGTFPVVVRSAAISSYPETVLRELQSAGFSLDELKRTQNKGADAESPWWGKAIGIGTIALFLLLVFGFVAQSFRGLGWFWERISGG